jgi:hypothetical protein
MIAQGVVVGAEEIFRPTIPITINMMLKIRNQLTGSLNRKTPAAAVPTTPIPTQIA